MKYLVRVNYGNEIIWHYPSMSRATKDFPKKHDTILRYVKSKSFVFNGDEVRTPYAQSTVNRAKHGKAGFARENGQPNYLNTVGKIPDSVWEIPHEKGKRNLG